MSEEYAHQSGTVCKNKHSIFMSTKEFSKEATASWGRLSFEQRMGTRKWLEWLCQTVKTLASQQLLSSKNNMLW